jgi:hypothetical protein
MLEQKNINGVVITHTLGFFVLVSIHSKVLEHRFLKNTHTHLERGYKITI